MIEVYKLLFGYRPDLISRSILDKVYASKLTNSDTQKFRPPYPLGDIESYYGLGMRTWKIKGCLNKDLIFHSGYIDGVTTFIGFIPSEEVGIVILVNNRTDFAVGSGFDLWKRLVN